MLKSKTRWKFPEERASAATSLMKELGISSLVARLLANRGWATVEAASQMLSVENQEFHDPFLLKGMKEAVERIRQAINRKEKILIYGDYDCDGVTSTTLLTYVLEELGAKFDYYIPDRFSEGYGLNGKALELAKQKGVQLVITVDNGIAAREEVAYGNQLGLEFIITDHHEVPLELPECVAVINPKQRNCPYPYKELAGVGVTLKLAQALLGKVPVELLDLAAIGTIADLVPLTGENRLIAYHGLSVINRTRHVGLQALIEVSGLADQVINEEHIGFALGPRINASGRLETADKAVQLLTTTDGDKAKALAKELDALNRERQKLVDETAKEAIQWVESNYGEAVPPCLVVAKEGWNPGVLGIVAAKLVKLYYVPTIVLSIDTDRQEAKGSARSIEGFDLYQALSLCRELLTHFGGHTMAAGLTLAPEQVPLFREKMIQLAGDMLTEEDFIPLTRVDVVCQLEEITTASVEELSRLAPFGVGNPKPVFLLEQINLKECRTVGTERTHLKCVFEQDGLTLNGIGFGWGEISQHISRQAKLDVLGELGINQWNGHKEPQILIKDVRVKEQQFFDWRGLKGLEEKWSSIVFDEQVAICVCRPDKIGKLDIPSYMVQLDFDDAGQLLSSSPTSHLEAIDTFVIYDLPLSQRQAQELFKQIAHGKRFYLIFQQEEAHFFSSIPTRDTFKWYYAFLKQQGSFNIERDASKLAQWKGWSIESIHWMTEVFAELQFATVHNGVVILKDNPVKQDLTNSAIYQRKLEAIELEKRLLYSSHSEVQSTLINWMKTKEAFCYEFKR